MVISLSIGNLFISAIKQLIPPNRSLSGGIITLVFLKFNGKYRYCGSGQHYRVGNDPPQLREDRAKITCRCRLSRFYRMREGQDIRYGLKSAAPEDDAEYAVEIIKAAPHKFILFSYHLKRF